MERDNSYRWSEYTEKAMSSKQLKTIFSKIYLNLWRLTCEQMILWNCGTELDGIDKL